MSEQRQLSDHMHMLSDQDRAWLEFRDAVNARIDAEEATAEADRDAQEARLHDEWLADQRAATEQGSATQRRAPADDSDQVPPVVRCESPVLAESDTLDEEPPAPAESDTLDDAIKAGVGLWLIHQISGWPWGLGRSC
jgi:hypothetical protein